jgi:hypothetical protein
VRGGGPTDCAEWPIIGRAAVNVSCGKAVLHEKSQPWLRLFPNRCFTLKVDLS